jgi:hypothetical protein
VGAFQQTVIEIGLQDIVNITMDYIAQVDKSEPSGFSSKHGPTEVIGDFTELCLMTMSNQWFETVVCADVDYDDIPTNIPKCLASVIRCVLFLFDTNFRM